MLLLAKRLYAQQLRIFAFACSHYGTESHDKDLWRAFLKKVEATPNAIVFGLGDYYDFARTAWRSHMKTFGEEDTFFESIDEMVDGQLVRPMCKEILKYCPSFREKCVIFVEGNHRYVYGSGSWSGRTSTEKMCEILKIPYGGLASWVRLTVYRSKGAKKWGTGHNLNILLNHGQSSGSSVTASLSKIENQVVTGWRGVDVIFSAHNHTLGHAVGAQLGTTQRGNLQLLEYPLLFAKVGCFKKAYLDGARSSSYEEKNLFRPNRRGWFECRAAIYQHPRYERWKFFDFQD